MNVGKNLKALRLKKGWTQGDLSEATGMKVDHISKLENDKGDPKLSTIEKLITALECDFNALLLTRTSGGLSSAMKYYIKEMESLGGGDKKTLFTIMDKFIATNLVKSIKVNGWSISEAVERIEQDQAEDRYHVNKLIDEDEEIQYEIKQQEEYEHHLKKG